MPLIAVYLLVKLWLLIFGLHLITSRSDFGPHRGVTLDFIGSRRGLEPHRAALRCGIIDSPRSQASKNNIPSTWRTRNHHLPFLTLSDVYPVPRNCFTLLDWYHSFHYCCVVNKNTWNVLAVTFLRSLSFIITVSYFCY